MTRSSYPHRVALLFDARQIYDREILRGIGTYFSSTRVKWDVLLEEDFCHPLLEIAQWQGDGIIADFDDPEMCEVLRQVKMPVVALGSAFECLVDHPAHIPYVGTDNVKIVHMACDHLIEAGLTRFAMLSLPAAQNNRWAQLREQAFCARLEKEALTAEIYRGKSVATQTWDEAIVAMSDWLRALPKPIGIVAVNDARARQLLQACQWADIAVPDEVAIIGVDDDPLTRILVRTPISSVTQGCEKMGRVAAQLLHQMIDGSHLPETRILVPPTGIHALASSQYYPVHGPIVMRARYFIRQYACQGIKTEQVADYVGVSRSTLEHQFRSEVGHSVHEDILKTKLDRAKALFDQGGVPSAHIATMCGFTSLQYLHAVFQREMGCTPREYQRRLQVREAD